MNEKELMNLIEKFKTKLKGDKKASRQFLVDVGIFTKDGKLTKPYKDLQNGT